MGLFDRIFGTPSQGRDERLLPSDARQLLIRYARQEIVPGHEDLEARRRISSLEGAIYLRIEADPTVLYSELAAVAAGQKDWAAVGAAWFIKDLGVPGYQSHPIACELMELATEFLRARNIQHYVLAPSQMAWWSQSHRGESWLTYPPLPDRSRYPIADLEPGEERPIVRWGPLGNNNVIVMKREQDGTYAAYIRYPRSQDPTEPIADDWQWYKNADRYNLAVYVTGTFNNIPQWVSPDFVPYMLPAPDYS